MKCNRTHHRGKVYKDHLEFKRKNENTPPESIKINDVQDLELKGLRPIAKKQILRFLKKIKTNGRKNLYLSEINRILLHEYDV